MSCYAAAYLAYLLGEERRMSQEVPSELIRGCRGLGR
jgi:hypothetical protein